MDLRPYGESTIIIPCEVEWRWPSPELAAPGVRGHPAWVIGEIGPAMGQSRQSRDFFQEARASSYAPVMPMPPVVIPGTGANEEFVRSTVTGLRALRNWLSSMVESQEPENRPPPGSRGIDETEWSGNHAEIKGALIAGGTDNVKIAPNSDVWSENADGSWTNYGPAANLTASGKPAGGTGKDRRNRESRQRQRSEE